MAKITRLKFNDPAPDVELLTTDGAKIKLSSLWQDHTLLVAFTRHFGCPHCKEMLDELSHAHVDLEQAGLYLVAITQGTPDTTREFCKRFAPNVLCLADPDREAYHAFGIERGNWYQVALAPQVVSGTIEAHHHGHSAEMPPKGQDVRQMSGTFIIGRDGRVRLPYYYDTIADHPPIELLLRGVLGTTWDKPFDGSLA
jgi:peroxiredoxin